MGSRTKDQAPVAEAENDEEAETTEAKENPRTVRSRENLAKAVSLLTKELKDGKWHSSNAIHKKFGESGTKEISEGMFGRAKSEMGIVHRRTKGENGKTEYQWRLPQEGDNDEAASAA